MFIDIVIIPKKLLIVPKNQYNEFQIFVTHGFFVPGKVFITSYVGKSNFKKYIKKVQMLSKNI